MSSMKSFFIAILLVICLHVISSLAIPLSDHQISDPWILSNVAGNPMHLGQTVVLQIRSPSITTVNINLLQRVPFFNQTLVTDIKLCVGYNEVKVTIPESGLKSSPQTYFAIFEKGVRVDYSATFEIGHPGFGITFLQPVAGAVLKVGDILIPRWKVDGSFVPEGANPSTFKVERCLFEPAKLPTPQRSKNFQNGVDFDFTKGSLEYQIPLNTIPDTLYKFGCLVINRATNPWEFHVYSAGTFLIIS
ncbi:hypothetical protein Glove_91g90 [Diversispora epigaea]|uniref:Uncharacterized protein n=1 Tax=Diversispora epigaea TaxID=1348612 RepID=A0A397J657_9GLOM|nr:hypothetical protein Glove_91g90 [Diversispora epigaea]